ncbi:BAG family molecular chaperone regulator 2 isoform X2 [Drosophila bipectinata]|uniref:BAG family molecular chaperone regulator 2 isoform X2 n=1 Tax=Drosophila bipectinata TaxID=42026 RepID=UPI001C891AD8|nr:BAG family molecular chaperone regulator 2 isoform X2 [Drosophila bipectinata]XP_043067924.1 BAG family molecular chaperone regulator 2 isoform X2 [Drosophila bipectinata]
MLENLRGIFRKRRRCESDPPPTPPTPPPQPAHYQPPPPAEGPGLMGRYPDDLSNDGFSDSWVDAYFHNTQQIDRPYNANERFVNIIDQMDARVEKLRKDALNLQEKKDYLLMSIDLIKSNEMMQNMSEAEREEIMLYIQRVSSRLGTVELNVRTVRDNSQEDSLSQINALIDTMIKMGDPVIARQRCQLYLNACCSSSMDPSGYMDTVPEADVGPIDKKFESALLGCTLDDQKNIKKRLQALMGYLNKQTVSH